VDKVQPPPFPRPPEALPPFHTTLVEHRTQVATRQGARVGLLVLRPQTSSPGLVARDRRSQYRCEDEQKKGGTSELPPFSRGHSHAQEARVLKVEKKESLAPSLLFLSPSFSFSKPFLPLVSKRLSKKLSPQASRKKEKELEETSFSPSPTCTPHHRRGLSRSVSRRRCRHQSEEEGPPRALGTLYTPGITGETRVWGQKHASLTTQPPSRRGRRCHGAFGRQTPSGPRSPPASLSTPRW
jgi:hypothetical protein